jgi:hypothetical protein
LIGEGERCDSGIGFSRGKVDVLFVGEELPGWAMRGMTFELFGDFGGREREGLMG